MLLIERHDSFRLIQKQSISRAGNKETKQKTIAQIEQKEKMKIAFIGSGVMGTGIINNFLKNKYFYIFFYNFYNFNFEFDVWMNICVGIIVSLNLIIIY